MSVPPSAASGSTLAQGEPALVLVVSTPGPSTVVKAVGELDIDTVAQLTHLLDDLTAAGTHLPLVLDLRQITFMSAAGITALLYVRDLLASEGGRLMLHRPTPWVRRVLAMSEMISLFDITDAGPSA